MHCTAAYNSMEAAVYNMYDRNNATIQDKLHELFEVLERTGKTWNRVCKKKDLLRLVLIWLRFLATCSICKTCQGKPIFTPNVCITVATAKQEAELEEFKTALAALYSDIQGAPL